MYCLPATYLWFNPVHLSSTWVAVAASLHVLGYVLFLDSNTQRTAFRRDMALNDNNPSKVVAWEDPLLLLHRQWDCLPTNDFAVRCVTPEHALTPCVSAVAAVAFSPG